MNKTPFTEAQIVFPLRQADTGVTVAEVCMPQVGIREASYYNWKKQCGGFVHELRHLKQLEEKNKRIKPLVADRSLDKQLP